MRGHIALYVPNRTEMKIYFQALALAPKGGAYFAQSQFGATSKMELRVFDDILPEAKG